MLWLRALLALPLVLLCVVWGCGKTTGDAIPLGDNQFAHSAVGTNLEGVSYFDSSSWVFIDFFNKASQWFAGSPSLGFDSGTISSYDSFGYPTGVTGDTTLDILLFDKMHGHFPAGTYVLYWEGSGGQIVVDESASNLRCEDGSTISNSTDCPTKRALFDVSPTHDGIYFQIRPDSADTYSATNYIRNIRVIAPGGVCGTSSTSLDLLRYCATSRGGSGSCAKGESCYDFDDVQFNRFSDPVSDMKSKVVFHPLYLQSLKKFRSLRFVEWARVNSSTLTHWSDRTSLSHYAMSTSSGVALEFQVELANLVKAEPWFSIPHLATDEFVTEMATLIRDQIIDGLNIYLEYSNEHFNTDPDFNQSDYFLSQAVANNVGAGDNDNVRRSKYYAIRAAQVYDLFRTVFSSNPDRLIRVLGTWITFTENTQALLDSESAAGKFDAIALGAYMSGALVDLSFLEQVQTFSVDQLFSEFFNGGLSETEAPQGGVQEALGFLDEQVALIQQHSGIQILGYEGGHHLSIVTQDVDVNTGLFVSAVEDPRMETAYNSLLGRWRQLGLHTFNHFLHIHPRTSGSFGSKPYQDSVGNDFPVFRTIDRFLRENPCWWDNCAIAARQ